ncbi:MAG: HAMP domain-containing protein [Anaerolineae bacterium]|nr:HAMP domain-containing protein [Anaerolineae bacterium]
MVGIKNASLKIGRRELLAMIAGIILYAVLSRSTFFANFAGADIRPAVAIPILFGFIYGPIVGFVTGMFGNLAFDLWNANIPLPPDVGLVYSTNLATLTATYFLNWQIGNGLSGLIPGLMALYHRRYTSSLTDVGQMVAFIIGGTAIGIGFACLTDSFVFVDYPIQVSFETYFLSIFRHNLLSALLFVPILLFNYERLDLKYLFSGTWLRSGLLRRLTVLIVISAAIPTILLSFFLLQEDTSVQQEVLSLQQQVAELQTFIQTTGAAGSADLPVPETAESAESGDSLLLAQLIVTIVLTLAVTIINSVLASQSISRPLLKLTDAARQMESGDLSLDGAKALENTVGTDEVSQLSSMFGSMASEVISREAALKQQVESLKIEVDMVKQQRAVSEITDSDFFKDLQGKARHLRARDEANTSQLRVKDILTAVDTGEAILSTIKDISTVVDAEETLPSTTVDEFILEDDDPVSTGD